MYVRMYVCAFVTVGYRAKLWLVALSRVEITETVYTMREGLETSFTWSRVGNSPRVRVSGKMRFACTFFLIWRAGRGTFRQEGGR